MDNNILDGIKRCMFDFTLDEAKNLYKKTVAKDEFSQIALCARLAELTTGLTPSNNQLYAAYKMYQGKVIEMPTGDGKTLAGLITLLAWLKDGKTATYVTSNDYLAKRDFAFFKKTLDVIGLKTLLLDINCDCESKKDANLIVADSTTLITNFLLDCSKPNEPYYLTHCILIDEFDTVLIDGAREPARIAETINYDMSLFDSVYAATESHKNESLTAELIVKIVEEVGMTFEDYISNKKYLREILLDCIESWKLKEDVDYIIDNGSIVLLDKQGRRTNKGYFRFVQLAVEKRHGLKFSEPKNVLIGMSYEGLINLYVGPISGMSGTLDTEEDFIKNHYGLELEVLSADIPSKRRILPDILVLESDNAAIVKQVVHTVSIYNKRNNPILIFAQTIMESEEISTKLTELGIEHVLLNAKNSDEEAEIIANAGKSKRITIMTTMAGRGTDIVVDDDGKKDGGLVILATGHLGTERLDKQLVGRTGRRGDPGLVQFFSKAILSPQEMKIIEVASRMSVEEAQDKLRDMVRNNLYREQEQKDKMEHELRDYLSCYYKVIDSQLSALLKSKNAILSMSQDEFVEYLLNSFESKIMRDVIALSSNDILSDIYRTKEKVAEYITKLSCDHYNTLTQYMKHSSFLQKHLPDPFSNFQKMAINSYDDLMCKYKSGFIKIVAGMLTKGV